MLPSGNPLRRVIRQYPLGVLLAALLLMILGSPLSAGLSRHFHYLHGEAAQAPLILILTISAGYAIWPMAKFRAAAIVLAGVVLALLALSTIFRHDSLAITHLIAQAIFLFYVTGVILRVVFTAPVVDGNILCGAICIYLLAGVLFGFLYWLLDLFQPGSFVILPAAGQIVPDHPTPPWLFYFSFSTMTTVGFGDIIPTRNFSRGLAILEAIVGQIMVVVMIARLVGLHVAQVASGKSRPVAFEVTNSPQQRRTKS